MPLSAFGWAWRLRLVRVRVRRTSGRSVARDARVRSVASSKGDQETNPLDYWSKGHVPADWKVVRYLAELGFKRAMLREPQHPRQQPG